MSETWGRDDVQEWIMRMALEDRCLYAATVHDQYFDSYLIATRHYGSWIGALRATLAEFILPGDGIDPAHTVARRAVEHAIDNEESIQAICREHGALLQNASGPPMTTAEAVRAAQTASEHACVGAGVAPVEHPPCRYGMPKLSEDECDRFLAPDDLRDDATISHAWIRDHLPWLVDECEARGVTIYVTSSLVTLGAPIPGGRAELGMTHERVRMLIHDEEDRSKIRRGLAEYAPLPDGATEADPEPEPDEGDHLARFFLTPASDWSAPGAAWRPEPEEAPPEPPPPRELTPAEVVARLVDGEAVWVSGDLGQRASDLLSARAAQGINLSILAGGGRRSLARAVCLPEHEVRHLADMARRAREES